GAGPGDRPASGIGASQPFPDVRAWAPVHRDGGEAAGGQTVRPPGDTHLDGACLGRAGRRLVARSIALDIEATRERHPGTGALRLARRGRPGASLRGPARARARYLSRADVPATPAEARSGRPTGARGEVPTRPSHRRRAGRG